MISYWSVVWEPKTRQLGSGRVLSGKTTLIATLKDILNLPLHIQGKSRAVEYIFIQKLTPLIQPDGTDIKDWQKNLVVFYTREVCSGLEEWPTAEGRIILVYR